MEPADKAARDLLATIEAMYQPMQHYVPADAKAFAHLDLRFYARTSRLLGSNGFRALGDVEDTNITTAPHGALMPVLMRTMLSKDGKVMASLFHVRIRSVGQRVLLWLMRRLPGRVVTLETEFSDRSFVVTSTAGIADIPAGTSAVVSEELLPPTATALAVHHRHASRVAAHLAARPGTRALAIATLADMLAAQNRLNAMKAAVRGEIAGVTLADLDCLTPDNVQRAGSAHGPGAHRLKRAG